MTARHTMQLMNRYMEEIETGADVKSASFTLISAMFFPGVTSIITDALGVALVAIAAIPILTNIAIACTFWSVATVILSMIFIPLVLSYMRPSARLRAQVQELKAKRARNELRMLENALSRLGGWILGKGKWVVVAANILLVVIGIPYARNMKVGDFFPGSSILWPWHRYNKDAMRIITNFRTKSP